MLHFAKDYTKPPTNIENEPKNISNPTKRLKVFNNVIFHLDMGTSTDGRSYLGSRLNSFCKSKKSRDIVFFIFTILIFLSQLHVKWT